MTDTDTDWVIPREELLDALRELADDLGRTPPQIVMNECGRYSITPYKNRFGSWNDAVRAAGLTANTRATTPTTCEELLDALRELADDLGRTPTAAEMNRRGRYGTTAYYAQFGSWNEAVRAVGLTPNSSGGTPTTCEELLDALRELTDNLGRTPTAAEMNKRGRYSTTPYYNQFGTWNQAVRAAGLTPD